MDKTEAWYDYGSDDMDDLLFHSQKRAFMAGYEAGSPKGQKKLLEKQNNDYVFTTILLMVISSVISICITYLVVRL